jgi:hypothetical protein
LRGRLPAREGTLLNTGARVPHYTLYFFDQANLSTGFLEFECADDGQALEILKARRVGRAVELWREDQRLLWWPADK